MAKFYVHSKFKDVFVELLRVQGSRALIRWWNLGFDNKPWIVPVKKHKTYIQDKQWIDLDKLNNMVEFDPNKPETHPGRSKNV